MIEKLKKIVEKYRQIGIFKGVEFLLPPEYAISLIDDLARLGIIIWGCDLWRFLDPDKKQQRIIALVGAGMLVNRPESPEIVTAEGNAEAVKEFIQYRLPEDAELVSFIFDDFDVYDTFIK